MPGEVTYWFGILLLDPPVVVHRGVQRHRPVTDIMAQPPGVEDGRRLHRLGVLACGRLLAILAQRGLQPLVDLVRDPRLQPDLLRPQITA